MKTDTVLVFNPVESCSSCRKLFCLVVKTARDTLVRVPLPRGHLMDLFAVTLYSRDPGSGRVLLHAMPVMLVVLCCLAIAYRYYSRVPRREGRGARRLAASRPPTGSTTARTTTRRTSGCCSATTSRPSPGPGRSSARCWPSSTATCRACCGWSIGVCLAGAVQDMLVLAASVRRDGKSLAEIARHELGPPGRADRVGGDPVHRRHRPGRAGLRGGQGARRRGGEAAGRDGNPDPERTALQARSTGGRAIHLRRVPRWLPGAILARIRGDDAPNRSESSAPPTCNTRRCATRRRSKRRASSSLGEACSDFMEFPDRLHRSPRRLHPGRPRQLVGHVHHRLHDPDRAVRRPVDVPHPQGAGRRGVAHRRRRSRSARSWSAGWMPGSPLERVLLAHPRPDHRRPRASTASSPPCCRSGCCSARATTSSSFLKIGTIALLVVGVFVANPALHAPPVNEVFVNGGPTFPGQHLPVRVHLHHVRGDQRVPRARVVAARRRR